MWQTPIDNRTAAAVAAGAESCFFSPQLLNRIEGNTAFLADRLGVALPKPRVWTNLDYLTEGEMRRILRQLTQVRAAARLPPGYYAVPAYPATDWQAVNAIERLQKKLYELWQTEQTKELYTGELYTGEAMGVI